jgi:methenyltetrahydrofolate cyclohydrolase
VPESSVLDLTVRDLLAAVAARTTAPGGGGAAALATALAAALVGMASRFGDGAVAAEADDLRARAAPLADADADAYLAFLTAMRLPRDDPSRPAAVAGARDGAVAVPAEIAELAAAVAGLGSGLVLGGNPRLRGDAAAAVHLAAAAAATAAVLVDANVPAGADEPRLARAMAAAEEARSLSAAVDGAR